MKFVVGWSGSSAQLLHTESCTVVRNRCIKVSVLSPLLFAVVTSGARSGLPSEFLYADDLLDQ